MGCCLSRRSQTGQSVQRQTRSLQTPQGQRVYSSIAIDRPYHEFERRPGSSRTGTGRDDAESIEQVAEKYRTLQARFNQRLSQEIIIRTETDLRTIHQLQQRIKELEEHRNRDLSYLEQVKRELQANKVKRRELEQENHGLRSQNAGLQIQLAEYREQVQRKEESVCTNEECRAAKLRLQKKAEEIKDGFYKAAKCPRPDCQKFQERIQAQAMPIGQRRSPAKYMTIMSGGDYDAALQSFEEVFTDPDELLGVLESCLDPFIAKKTLCEIFQCAYKLSKEAVLEQVIKTLEALFTLNEERCKKGDLEDTSRAYGLLLHVAGFPRKDAIFRDISLKVMKELANTEAYSNAVKVLEDKQEYLQKAVEVAWKFVTFPAPIIACEPETYMAENVDREYGYWDVSSPEAVLIYTRPIVYRCYDGNRAVKGMVANTENELV